MSNRFEDLNAQIDNLDDLLEAPENYDTPEAFISAVQEAAREIVTIGDQLTAEDFTAEYESEGDE